MAICLYNPSDTAAPRHLPLQQGRLIVGGSKRCAAFPCTGGLILEEAPLCKGSSRGAGEGLFLLSFCRIIQ